MVNSEWWLLALPVVFAAGCLTLPQQPHPGTAGPPKIDEVFEAAVRRKQTGAHAVGMEVQSVLMADVVDQVLLWTSPRHKVAVSLIVRDNPGWYDGHGGEPSGIHVVGEIRAVSVPEKTMTLECKAGDIVVLTVE
jgi:hypothetical protein